MTPSAATAKSVHIAGAPQRWAKRVWLLLSLCATVAARTYHSGVFPRPDATDLQPTASDRALWIDREPFGIHQLVLQGSAFGRGKLAGEHTAALLQRQESELVGQLETLIPSPSALQLLILSSIVWFQGLDRYFEPWATSEMWGVSLSAPHRFDYLADPFTRQIAYHGLHEVGQIMVDRGFEDMGCTVVALPWGGNWILGRNFDFEGGRIFDEEKIVKWVFPQDGNAYVSITWAGMVGVVTGVNERGLYLSLNAAGSDDFRRIGTPSTLVVLKALQFSHSAEEALHIIEESTVFITDFYVLLDAQTGRLFRIEKSPLHTVVSEEHAPTAIANHLISSQWAHDETNTFRSNELTSAVRRSRGLSLVNQLSRSAAGQEDEATHDRVLDGLLAIVRDKGVDEGGQPLVLGNRRAIDALIATHSVLYDPLAHVLYVSQGPSVSGAFTGLDLNASFREHRPVLSQRSLPADPLVPPERY
ncbi:MAG TPA: C45 family peptidase, partial [Polyangiaceae bacterium]|nr:C45 family peptidase [Polyangiaceae bacterium]